MNLTMMTRIGITEDSHTPDAIDTLTKVGLFANYSRCKLKRSYSSLMWIGIHINK